MTNRLKAYVRRTIMSAAKEYAYPKSRRTADSTRSACMDATRGIDTGWWSDLIYTAPMLEMARSYRMDILTALQEYYDATGEEYSYRNLDFGKFDITAGRIAISLAARKPYTLDDYHSEGPIGDAASCALHGLRFAVEWYAGEIARDLCPDL